MAKSKRTKTKTKTKPAAKPVDAKVVKQVAQSFSALATSLGHDACVSASNSGDIDYYIDEDLDIDSLYYDYWSKNYRYLFYGSFYALADELRGDPSVRAEIDEGFSRYMKAARDEKAAFKYAKKIKLSWIITKRLATLRYFDGAKDQKLPSVSFATLDKRMKKDKLS